MNSGVELKEKVIKLCDSKVEMTRTELELYLCSLVQKNLTNGHNSCWILKVCIQKSLESSNSEQNIEILYWRPRKYTLVSCFDQGGYNSDQNNLDGWKKPYKILVNDARLWKNLSFLGCPNSKVWTVKKAEIIKTRRIGIEENNFYYSKNL